MHQYFFVIYLNSNVTLSVVYKGGDWLNSFNAKLLRRSLSSRLTLLKMTPSYIRTHPLLYSYYRSYAEASYLPFTPLPLHSFILSLPVPLLCVSSVLFVSFVLYASVLCVSPVCLCCSSRSSLFVSFVSVRRVCSARRVHLVRLVHLTRLVCLARLALPPEQFTHSNYSSYSSYSSCLKCSNRLSCSTPCLPPYPFPIP